MTTFTNDELLILLIEECSEVIQAATKCLRFGYDVDHQTGYGNNKVVLSREIGDILGIVDVMDLDRFAVGEDRSTKIERAKKAKLKYGK
jgi:hypothetical protein